MMLIFGRTGSNTLVLRIPLFIIMFFSAISATMAMDDDPRFALLGADPNHEFVMGSA